MKSEIINVYDFDKTIYDGDSTVDFYRYCLKNYPVIIKWWPSLIFYALLFGLKLISKTKFKEKLYRFLRSIPDIEKAEDDFWKSNHKKIKSWYMEQKQATDLIISASPVFNLKKICTDLDVRLIASRVDPKTGLYNGLNCYGEEKVRRMRSEYPNIKINEFYSDSLSDSPLAHLAEKAFLVKDDIRKPWPGKI